MKEYKQKLARRTLNKLLHEGIGSDAPRFPLVCSAVIEEMEEKEEKERIRKAKKS